MATYFLALQKHRNANEDLYIRVEPKALWGLRSAYVLKLQKVHASKLSYLQAKLHQFICPLFSLKDEKGNTSKANKLGRIVIIQ